MTEEKIDSKEKKEVATTEKESKNKVKTESGEKDKAKEGGTKAAKKSKKRIVQVGSAYIKATFNNTLVSITDAEGNILAWSSAGSSGFKGARKATPYAGQVAAENATEKAKAYGIEKVTVFVSGVGSGRDQAMRGLVGKGLEIIAINDVTPIPHNGCRKKKARRV